MTPAQVAGNQEVKVATAVERFWDKVDRSDIEGCWTWTGYKDPKGYGQLWANHKMTLAHRFIWAEINGPIPEVCVYVTTAIIRLVCAFPTYS